MTVSKTRRFHILRGPASLFEHAPLVLTQWTANGVVLTGDHAHTRLAERRIDERWFADFDTDLWQVITCDVKQKQKDIGYITARRPIDKQRQRWLWAVFVHEHLVTAWVRSNPRLQAVSADTVTEGELWDAVRCRYEAEIAAREQEVFEAELAAWEHRETKIRPIPLPNSPELSSVLIADNEPASKRNHAQNLPHRVHKWAKKLLDTMRRFTSG